MRREGRQGDGGQRRGLGGDPGGFIVTALQDAIPRLIAIEDAIEVGDPNTAYLIATDLETDLVIAVESSRRREVQRSRRRDVLCPCCGLDCRWPGRLEDHLRNVHEEMSA